MAAGRSWRYDVFLNFRGEDTRYGFTGHLYDALHKMGIRTFFDDEEIKIGDELTPTLLKAIQDSRMAIPVFSEEYASSTFCLDELVHIHQCIKGDGRRIWPIFYDVDPSEVRHQRGKYGEALSKHAKNSRADDEKMRSWKHALHEVANLKGTSYDKSKVYEREVIKEVVNHIIGLIKREPLEFPTSYLVGLTTRVEKVNSLLQLGSNDNNVIMIGICGTGGMGKTTIARAVYNAIADHFDYLCFLEDIKGESIKHGLQQQQAKMLSKFLGEKKEIEDIDEGVKLIKRILKGKKILLILDNVDEHKQLQKLARECEWFGPGSRIIITTRDSHLLKYHGVERIYEVEELTHEESLQLLSWMAFRKMEVDQSYKDVMEDVIRYANGLPLALELIGSDLYGKDVKNWESRIDGFKIAPHDKIQQILRVSYDGLGQLEKEVFLDIACFYNGSTLKYVNTMVACAHSGFNPRDHIEVLKEKCLIKIVKSFHMEDIKMHDLVQDMGREVIRQQSLRDPEKRSRLWSSEDIVRVLEENEGTSDVIIIIQVDRFECIEIDWDGKAFKGMKSLKILIFENAKFSKGPKYLPDSLSILRWRGYPSSSLPDGFRPKHLVELNLEDSDIKSIEKTVSKMPLQKANVTVLNFSECKFLEKIPDLSRLPSLKKLKLGGCINLIEIDNSVGQLPKLKTLNAGGCTQLRIFPSEMNTPSLVRLSLVDCINLIGIDNSVGQLAKLQILNVSGCTQLRTFPSEMNTPSLFRLRVDNCSNLNYFPEIVTREMELRVLELYETGIHQLPPSCENLTEVYRLEIVANSRNRSLKLPSNTSLMPALESIRITGFDEELIMEVEPITDRSMTIELMKCKISNENLQTCLVAFSNVRLLDLTGSDFTILPACIEDCRNLVTIVLDGCKHLIEVERVPPNIKNFAAAGCTSLSSKSRKLLLSKELLASVVPINLEYEAGTAHFCVPGGSIPGWFDHCSKGSSISFWFRDHYFKSKLIFCAIHEPKGGLCPHFSIEIFENEVKCVSWMMALHEIIGCDEDFITMDYIREVTWKNSSGKGHWNHAKICLSTPFVKESGIYVIRDGRTNMENIRFTDPFQCLDLLTNDQGCTIEGDTVATNNPLSSSKIEWRHSDSHAVLDIDGLRRLSAGCRKLTFPISIHMDFGIVGSQLEYDICITKQDVMEFLCMEKLCITIIQLFVMFAESLCRDREIDDRFGFLCPNAVQSVGHTREDRISYIGSTIKEGNKQCWLAPIHEGNHWTLCAICLESNIIYWFDSLGREQSDDIEKVFTKALEICQIRRETDTKWLCPNYRRQFGGKECGYYIMGYIYDIINLNQVHSLDKQFNNPQSYSQEDINVVRNIWSDYFLEHRRIKRDCRFPLRLV